MSIIPSCFGTNRVVLVLRWARMLTVIALWPGLLLPAGGGLTRRDALAAVAASPALLARPAAAPAATSAVPTKDMESIKALT